MVKEHFPEISFIYSYNITTAHKKFLVHGIMIELNSEGQSIQLTPTILPLSLSSVKLYFFYDSFFVV